jgi:hypothetical protein
MVYITSLSLKVLKYRDVAQSKSALRGKYNYVLRREDPRRCSRKVYRSPIFCDFLKQPGYKLVLVDHKFDLLMRPRPTMPGGAKGVCQISYGKLGVTNCL